MAELHHLVGAILRDLAQGRVTSDLYSREVSRYYEQDSLLRLFPIPRTEIKEVEIDLKFALAEIAIDPDRTDDRGAKLSGIFERYGEAITNAVLTTLQATAPRNAGWQSLVPEFVTENRTALTTEVVNYFEANKDKLVEQQTVTTQAGQTDSNLTLKKPATLSGLKEIIERIVYVPLSAQLSAASIAGGSKALPTAKTAVSKELLSQVNSLSNEVEYVEATEYKAEVMVTAAELQTIAEVSISSIRIVTSMRNYVWSQVDEKDGQSIRRLIPE
jgi:hypothetical protein